MKQKRKKFRQQMAAILATCMIGTAVPVDVVIAGDLSDGTGEVVQQAETIPEEEGILQKEDSEQENQEADMLQPEEEAADTLEPEMSQQDVLTGDTEELLLDDSSEEDLLSAGDEEEKE